MLVSFFSLHLLLLSVSHLDEQDEHVTLCTGEGIEIFICLPISDLCIQLLLILTEITCVTFSTSANLFAAHIN